MPITPDDLLGYAQELAEGGTEIALRTAISKAYYATLHDCRQFAQALPAPPPSKRFKGAHIGVIRSFKEFPHKSHPQYMKIRTVGFLLEEFKAKREVADYMLLTVLTSLEWEEALKSARRIRQEIAELRKLIATSVS